jgi:hypothetical protein
MKNSFFKTNTVMISSRMNEYLKNNFGYEIEGDLASLREAKASLEAQKRDMRADHQDRAYVENMLMLETIKSLLKAHVAEGELPPGLKAYQDKKKGKKKGPLDAGKVEDKVEEGTKLDEVSNAVKDQLANIDLSIRDWTRRWKNKSAGNPNDMKAPQKIKDLKAQKAALMKKHGITEENVSEAAERPYVCVHAKKGKHSCTAGSSYEAAKKAAKAWGLKSTAGIDAHLADVKHTATESVQPKVDTNKKNYENSYKAPKEYKMKKTKLEEGLLAQLNALLEGDAAEAEIIMAARGIVDELQDIIEKLGKIQNDQLGPLADEMSYTHGPEQADAFKASTDAAISTLLDTARQTKDEVNNAVLVLNGQAPATDMTAGEPELGGDMGDDFESDIEVDAMGGDEATSGPVDDPLGRAKR